MLVEELYAHFGNWTRMIKELDIGISTPRVWQKKGYIPYTSQLLIEKRTNGLFKACEEHGKPVK